MDEPRWGREFYCRKCAFACSERVGGEDVDVTTCVTERPMLLGNERTGEMEWERKYQVLLRWEEAQPEIRVWEDELRSGARLEPAWLAEGREAFLQVIEARKREDAGNVAPEEQEAPGGGTGEARRWYD